MKKLLIFLLLLPHAALADWGQFDFDFDSDKPWTEIEAQLPAYPRDEDLLPFFVSAATDNKFFVDGKSISVGDDGVVRYTILAKSPEGAANVTFEGMRCESSESKIYAFGRADGTWSKARFSKWEQIEYKDRNRQHHMLYDDFFCPAGIIIGSPEEAVKALKRGSHPRAGDFISP